MSSLALWYIPKNHDDQDNPNEIDVHFNLWKLPVNNKWFINRNFSRYLDIGLMMKNATKIQAINLYIPASVNENEIKDLGGLMKNDELVCAVFNDNLQVKTSGTSDFYDVKGEGKAFTIYKLGQENFRIRPAFGGTILEIDLSSNRYDMLYIRFRILGSYLDKLSFIDKPRNAVFQSAFYKTDTIDFRANEVRVLSNKLLEEIERGKKVKLKKIHFFFICSSREECFFSHVPYVNCRRLETEKWLTYIEKIPQGWFASFTAWLRHLRAEPEPPSPPILAYHWRPKENQDKAFDDFNVLIKSKYEQNDYLSILKYLIVAILIGLLVNLASSLIESWFTKDEQNTELTSYYTTFK